MKGRIMVVDDAQGIRDSLDVLLTGEGYKVFLAESGEEALRKLPEVAPDAMILDVNMPGIDGYQILKKIRKTIPRKELQIMMLTVNTKAEEEVEAFRLGVDEYVKKSFSNNVLLARVKLMFKSLKRFGKIIK